MFPFILAFSLLQKLFYLQKVVYLILFKKFKLSFFGGTFNKKWAFSYEIMGIDRKPSDWCNHLSYMTPSVAVESFPTHSLVSDARHAYNLKTRHKYNLLELYLWKICHSLSGRQIIRPLLRGSCRVKIITGMPFYFRTKWAMVREFT